MKNFNLNKLESKLNSICGYTFRNKALLIQAFTRSSFHNEHPEYPHNELLELFGDSVLSLTVLTCEQVKYTTVDSRGLHCPWSEAILSNVKHDQVKKQTLAEKMREMGLQEHLLLSRGDIGTDIAREDSVLEDLVESIIGAIYVDAGNDFSVASAAVRRMLQIEETLPPIDQKPHLSYRNDLQEWCQDPKRALRMPVYSETQDPNGNYRSTVTVSELGLSATAEGKNTKQARESAARVILEKIKALPSQAVDAVAFREKATETNYVGKLQEHLQAKKLPMAEYRDAGDETLSDNSHRFTVICCVEPATTKGVGSSKKEAKQHAAKAMLEHLKLLS